MSDRDRYPHLYDKANGRPLQDVNVVLTSEHPSLRRKATTLSLTPGVVDEDAEEFFGYGACCLLAAAMNECSTWPPLVVQRKREDGVISWIHMGVRAPDGRFVDILGPREDAEVMAQYAEYRPQWVREVTVADMIESGAICSDGWDAQCIPIAAELIRYFAAALVASWTPAPAPCAFTPKEQALV